MMYLGETTLNVALIHHPVVNKKKDVIGSAVTNLDIHDIARASRTYGVAQYFITTPYADQQGLVAELLEHWRTGHGASYNPARRQALEVVEIADSLEDVLTTLTAKYGKKPLLVATSATAQVNTKSFKEIRSAISDGEPILILFGTAHGLAPQIMEQADVFLPPIKAGTEYNHLSVRSAVSIIIDRLLGS